MTVQSKQSAKSSKSSTKQSIPAAGDGAPTNKPNVLDRFAKKKKPKAKKVAKKDRPKLDLDDDIQEDFAEFAPLKTLVDLLEARRKEQAKSLANDIWPIYLAALWAKKKAPETPAIEARDESGNVDCTGQFMVQQGSKIKVILPSVGDDEEADEVFVEALVDQGVQRDDAENLVANELDLTPEWSIDLTTLIRGSGPSQAAATKLFCWLQGEDEDGEELDDDAPLVLSAAEKQALSEYVDENATYDPKLLEPKDFLDRVCNYAQNEDNLKAILTMIRPLSYVTRAKFGVSSSETEKTERLREQAKEIVGEELDK